MSNRSNSLNWCLRHPKGRCARSTHWHGSKPCRSDQNIMIQLIKLSLLSIHSGSHSQPQLQLQIRVCAPRRKSFGFNNFSIFQAPSRFKVFHLSQTICSLFFSPMFSLRWSKHSNSPRLWRTLTTKSRPSRRLTLAGTQFQERISTEIQNSYVVYCDARRSAAPPTYSKVGQARSSSCTSQDGRGAAWQCRNSDTRSSAAVLRTCAAGFKSPLEDRQTQCSKPQPSAGPGV